jgi:hypothetical protein
MKRQLLFDADLMSERPRKAIKQLKYVIFATIKPNYHVTDIYYLHVMRDLV